MQSRNVTVLQRWILFEGVHDVKRLWQISCRHTGSPAFHQK